METIQRSSTLHQPDIDVDGRKGWKVTCTCGFTAKARLWSEVSNALDVHLDTVPNRVSLSALSVEI